MLNDVDNPISRALLESEAAPDFEIIPKPSTQQATAKKAAQILEGSNQGFKVLKPKQKQILLVEFAKRNLIIYGRAFDIVKSPEPINFNDPIEVSGNFNNITICEIKSTNKTLDAEFNGYFFALTAAELLVAQSLKERYRFVFVNTTNGHYQELTLKEIFGKAKGIYPTWSITF